MSGWTKSDDNMAEDGRLTGDTLSGSDESRCQRVCRRLKDNILLVLTAIGILLGFLLGFTLRLIEPSKDSVMWIGFPGKIFLRMLKMMITPLVVSSVITGTATLDPRVNGKISIVSLIHLVITNIMGTIIGCSVVLAAKPGVGIKVEDEMEKEVQRMRTQDIFGDLIRNIFPDNLVRATMQQTKTDFKVKNVSRIVNISGILEERFFEDSSVNLVYVDSSNILGLIMASMVFGIATQKAGKRGKPFLQFWSATADIVLMIMRWFLWYSPIGIASLIAGALAGIKDLVNTIQQLGLFVGVTSAGILFIQFIICPLIMFAFMRKNPLPFIMSLFRAWITAFASTSTAMAIPDVYAACDEHKIDKRVSRFCVPFCVTMNADGSAAFICAAALFLAQLRQLEVGAGEVAMIAFLTAVAVMALPSVPSSSIVTLVMVMSSLNWPTHDLALLFAVDWLLDRIRTTCNMMSHCTCTVVTYCVLKRDLAKVQAEMVNSEDEDDEHTV